MFESITLDALDKIGAMAVVVIIALAVITDKLVWHTRLKKAEARVERLEGMLWASISVNNKAVDATEVTSQLVQQLPPLAEGQK